MPGDEYASATRGTLKLKGVKDSKIDKPKKKRKKDKQDKPSLEENEKRPASGEHEGAEEEKERSSSRLGDERGEGPDEGDMALQGRVKTEAERRYEEVRRKRVSV